MIPKELTLLMAAYTTATSLQISLSYERQRVLSELHARGITPEDVTAICTELKHLIKCGTKGYTDSSLDFRNALGDPDRTEERALRLRQRESRKRKPQREVAHETKVGPNVISFLAPEECSTEVPRIDVRAGLIGLANSLKQA